MNASDEPRLGRDDGGMTTASASLANGPGLLRPARGLIRVLYTSNPFYVLSADLVFVGLRMSFGSGGPAAESWALTGSFAAYTLLLAATACVLIRLGRLW